MVYGDALKDILSTNKSLIFDYQSQSNDAESKKLEQSWINPIYAQYKKNYTTQFTTGTIDTGNFTVTIDQPIFRSGGIYYAMKYAHALRDANQAEIALQKRTMIGDAVSILFNLKKNRLEEQKLKYQIKNDIIDITQKRDSYEAGVLDSSFLDQAILKRSQDETALLQLQLSYMELKQRFSLLSDKEPQSLPLPTLKLISKKNYQESNLEIKRDTFRAAQTAYNEKVTWAKYLPALSVQGTYIDGDLNPLFFNPTLKERYYNYGFSLSMPIDITSFNDIEASKVAKLQAQVELIDKKETVIEEYDWIANSLGILDKKIALAQKDAKVYQSLFRLTSNLVKAGEKTSLDADIMHNSLQIRKLDQQIYTIDKQIQLLKLYIRVENVL